MKKLKKIILILLAAIFLLSSPVYAQAPEVKAQGAILIDADTGIVIFSKNANQKLYPASITKLMTILLTLEYAKGNYNEDVYFSREAVFSLPYDSSSIAMNDEETLTLEQCLYAILLASANEVANAVAEHIAGSMDAFAEKMSERAKELGCVRTQFMNPHGLHDDEHYTCAYDMSLIMRECVKYPEFIKVISTPRYDIPPTQKQPEIRVLNNTNRLIQKTSDFYNSDVIGGKTGFTDEAGHTLVTYSERGSARLICVVMKTAKNEIYTDTTALLNYGFNQYTDTAVFDKASFAKKIPVFQGSGDSADSAEIEVIASRDVKMYLPEAFDKKEVEQKVILPEKIFAPVLKGETVGHLMLMYQGMFLADVDLVAGSGVEYLPQASPAPAKDGNAEPKAANLEPVNEEPVIFGNTTITIAVITSILIILCIILRIALAVSRRRKLYRRRNMYLKSGLSKRYRYKNQ